MSITKYREDFLLLAEAGFIAINQADEDATKKLFAAAALLNKSNVLPKIGTGYLHLHKLELKQAVKCFEEVLEQEPNNEMAEAFMGLCISLMPEGATRGERMLEQSLKSKDPTLKKMAGTALDFIDQHVKGSSPASAPRKRK